MRNYILITGIVKTAEEITGVPGVVEFRGVDSNGDYIYNKKLNSLSNFRVSITPINRTNNNPYDYIVNGTGRLVVKSEWVKDIQVQVNWSLVPIDELVEVSANGQDWYKMHFAYYDENEPNGLKYLVFQAGRSSKTALNLKEIISVAVNSWSNLGGKYFILYSPNKTYYVWFNIDNASVDPASSGGPLQNTNFIGIMVNIQTGAPASFIASKIAQAVNNVNEFTATVSPNNNSIVDIMVNQSGMVYDASPGNSGLSINVKMQGGDIVGWPFARIPLP